MAENTPIRMPPLDGDRSKQDVADERDRSKLRRVPGPIPWILFLICVLEVYLPLSCLQSFRLTRSSLANASCIGGLAVPCKIIFSMFCFSTASAVYQFLIGIT